MKVPTEEHRISSRVEQSRTVRIRPAEPQFAAEIRTTLNVSYDGFYFATSIGHYVLGMVVYVTRDFQPNNPANREEQGTVVRVDKLRDSRWGVAVHLGRDKWHNKIT